MGQGFNRIWKDYWFKWGFGKWFGVAFGDLFWEKDCVFEEGNRRNLGEKGEISIGKGTVCLEIGVFGEEVGGLLGNLSMLSGFGWHYKRRKVWKG